MHNYLEISVCDPSKTKWATSNLFFQHAWENQLEMFKREYIPLVNKTKSEYTVPLYKQNINLREWAYKIGLLIGTDLG